MRKAVALRYDPAKPAPELVGKAVGSGAERAIERAGELGVPIVENACLTVALLPLDVGQLVPQEYWELIASILIALRNVEE